MYTFLLLSLLINSCQAVYSRVNYNFDLCKKFKTEDLCLDFYGCTWCNQSITKNNITSYNAECDSFNVCDDAPHNCSVAEYDYRYDCKIADAWFYFIIFGALILSIVLIVYVIEKMLIRHDVPSYVRNFIHTIVILLITIPILIFFATKELLFSQFFFFLIMVACMSGCIYGSIQMRNRRIIQIHAQLESEFVPPPLYSNNTEKKNEKEALLTNDN